MFRSSRTESYLTVPKKFSSLFGLFKALKVNSALINIALLGSLVSQSKQHSLWRTQVLAAIL